jgi:hypothetical protein
VWEPRHEWRTGGFGVRGSGIRGTCEPRHRMFRFPDREIPERNGSVDSLTIGIRDSGFSCACELCSREPRTPEARVHRFFGIHHFADLGDKRSWDTSYREIAKRDPNRLSAGTRSSNHRNGKSP